MAGCVMLALPDTIDGVLALPFVPIGDWGDLPDRPGLYFAVIDREHLVYVGITGVSLRRRWRYHHHRARLPTFGDVTVAYIESDDDSALYWAEIAAIKTFDPVMNNTPGFLVAFESTAHGKRFYRKSWDEVRPRKPAP
jgi:hypothetical protein